MSDISYADKSQSSAYDVAKWNAQDANEVKTVVNTKSNKLQLSNLAGAAWDIGTASFVEKTISANTSITLSGGTNGQSTGLLLIDNTGAFTLSVNSTSYPVRSNGLTAITVIKRINGTYYISSDYVAASSNITPPAPTAGTVNDTLDTFDWTNAVGYVTDDHETTLDGGTTWTNAVKPLSVGNIEKAIGQVGVRVKAATGRDVSTGLFNASAFTVTAGDTTPPTVVSATAINATTIRIVFSEVVTATNVGHTFKKGTTANNPTAIAGSGTTTLDFTVPTMLSTDVITRTYDTVAGNTLDAASNELVGYIDAAVTNSIAGGYPADLVHLYKFNNDLNDSVGTLHLTGVAAPTFGTGLIAQGMVVAAASAQGATVADTADVKTGVNKSRHAWFKVTTNAANQVIMGKVNADGTHKELLVFYNNSTGTISAKASTDGVNWNVQPTDLAITLGTGWHVVTVVFSSDASNNYLTVYLNGSATTSFAGTGSLAATFFTGTGPFQVGKYAVAGDSFNGSIDIVGLWNKALTAAEVNSIYNAGAGTEY